MTSRRGFLSSLLGASLVPALSWADAGSPDFLAAAKDPDDSFALYGLRADGSLAFRLPLPARGHAGAGHPSRPLAVAFARRPGSYALVIDCVRGEVLARLTPPEGRQFNGHGVFLDGGARLATSEQLAEGSAGRIGLWDSATWARLGEIDSQGIGPHDLRLMPDGRTLVLANGGIATDAKDRSKLNLPDMRPSLVWVDPDRGVTEEMALERDMHQASIRHLALRGDGLVAFAMQWEGDKVQSVPLLGLVRPGAAPVLARPGDAAQAGLMQGYAGSVAWSGDGERVAITSPRGSCLQLFDANGAFLETRAQDDVCGAAVLERGILTSDGRGGLWRHEAESQEELARHALAWDNHIVALRG